MKLLFAILSILLFLIGVKTHKKIHAIAGVVFMTMLVVSIITEMSDKGSMDVWIAKVKETVGQSGEPSQEQTPKPEEKEKPVPEPSKTPTPVKEAEENNTPTASKEAEQSNAPTSAKEPEKKETPTPAKEPEKKETPTPVKQSEQREAPTSSGKPVQTATLGSEEDTLEKTPSPSPANTEEKTYQAGNYGITEKEEKKFYGEDGKESYYYKMENFYLSATFSKRVNTTLQKIYDDYEEQYLRTAELIESGFDEFEEPVSGIPNDYWHLEGLKYVGKDYISILYNDIPYMSNTHPYSRYDGITINCRTGKQAVASDFLEKSNEEILEEVSDKMGLDEVGTWDDIDFYITDSAIVFFYRVPDWREDVVLPRE